MTKYKIYNADARSFEHDSDFIKEVNELDTAVTDEIRNMIQEQVNSSYSVFEKEYDKISDQMNEMKNEYEKRINRLFDRLDRHIKEKDEMEKVIKIKDEFILQTKTRRKEYPDFLNKLKSRTKWNLLEEEIDLELEGIGKKIQIRERRNG